MAASAPASRRIDLDWLRVLLFAGLIAYHLGLIYASWSPYALKSIHRAPWIEILLLTTHPWRMCLLFLISGVATRFAVGKLGAVKLLASRSRQLLPPLLFGIAFIVPIQSYLTAVEILGYGRPFWAFVPDLFQSGHKVTVAGRYLTMPVYAHLWFVAYLWVYVAIVAVVLGLAPRLMQAAQTWLERLMSGAGVLMWPLALMLVLRFTLNREFSINLGMVHDWYNHAISGGMFLFGFLIARTEKVWDRFVALRWPALAIAALAWAIYAWMAWNRGIPEVVERTNPIMHVLYPAERWCAIVAILGFSKRWLAGPLAIVADGPVLRYLNGAIFTYYIVHQPALLVMIHALKPMHLDAAAEVALVLAGTIACCGLAYEVARGLGGLGVLLGAPRGRAAPGWVVAVRGAAVGLFKDLAAPLDGRARHKARYGLEEQAQAQ